MSLLTGPAEASIRRGTSTNDFESCPQLLLRHKITSRQRAMGRLTTILHTTFKTGPFVGVLVQWEEEAQTHERDRFTTCKMALHKTSFEHERATFGTPTTSLDGNGHSPGYEGYHQKLH